MSTFSWVILAFTLLVVCPAIGAGFGLLVRRDCARLTAELDAARARVAEMEAENERLRAAVAAHRTAVTSDGKHLPF